MTKHEALKDLAAVLRDTLTRVPRVESGPAPLTAAQKFHNSNTTQAQGDSVSSLFTGLLTSLTGLGGGASSSSLLSGLIGSGQAGPRGGASAGSILNNLQGGVSGALGLSGLSPILSGLLGHFGGGGKTPAPRLPLYSAPHRLQQQSSLQGGVVSGANSNQSGMPRINSTARQPQVTLHIQAMDTQSILNRSTDIAQAVRQAMLQSHPINDVVADL